MYREQVLLHEFMQKFGDATYSKPTMPSADILKRMVALLLEEVLEFAHEAGFKATGIVFSDGKVVLDIQPNVMKKLPSMVGMADALTDNKYVIEWAALGLGLDLAPIFEEVHRSNMTKIWPDGKVHRREDGKILKPDSYSPADIAQKVLEQE